MFCKNCGIQLDDGSNFCNNCGINVSGSELAKTTAVEKPKNKRGAFHNFLLSFLLSSPLLIMNLWSWRIYQWFEFKLCLPGGVYMVMKDYKDYQKMQVWDKAISASEILVVFCWIGTVIYVLGMVLCIIEAKGIIRKSKLRSVCIFAIPAIVMIIVAICTYPAIFNYKSTFR